MLCLPARQLPEGPGWAYELKLDGYRGLGLKTGGRAQLWSRNAKDLGKRFVGIVGALESLPDETLVDGEIVAIDRDGLPSFSHLQDFTAAADRSIVFFAFDLPFLGGLDLRKQPLEARRESLRELIN